MSFYFHSPKSEDSIWEQGYAEFSDGKTTIGIHRLVAVAKLGIEEVKNKEVHHKNECKYDNRPENLEVMTKEEHSKLHNPVTFTKEECISSLKLFKSEQGKLPGYIKYRKWAKGRDAAPGPTIRYRYGSWNEALEAAFGRTQSEYQRYTKEDCERALKSFVVEHGREPKTAKEYGKWTDKGQPGRTPMRTKFGSWSEAKDEILPS